VAGALGLVAGGVLSDRLSDRHPTRGLKLCASASVLAIPLIGASLFMPTVLGAALVFGVAYCLGMIYAGPTISMICRVVPARRRALSIGILLAAMNLLGLGLGPLFIGILADALPAGANGLKNGMLIEALLYVPAALLYFRASSTAARVAHGNQ
jgi:MFS family permease